MTYEPGHPREEPLSEQLFRCFFILDNILLIVSHQRFILLYSLGSSHIIQRFCCFPNSRRELLQPRRHLSIDVSTLPRNSVKELEE